MKVTIEGPDMSALRAKLQQKINNAQGVLTVECKKAADFFTPFSDAQGTDHMRDDFVYIKDERGALNGWAYRRKYARRQWWGVTKAGTPFKYTLRVNSNARSRWTEHGAQVFKEGIVAKVKAELEK